MIYIISGVSRSGKSKLCRKLFKTINVPYIPVDHLMMGFQNGLPETGVSHETFSYEIAEKMWPFLESVIESMIYAEQDYIFEGEAFNAKDVKKLINKFPDKIKIIYLGYTTISKQEKFKLVKKHDNPADWLLQRSDEFILNHIESMIKLSSRIKQEAEIYNLPYFDTSNDYQVVIREVINYLT